MRKQGIAALVIAAAALLFTPANGRAQGYPAPFALCSWLSGDVSISTGYSGGKGIDFWFSALARHRGSVTELHQRYPMKGIGLDAEIQLKTPGLLGFRAKASYCPCFQSTSQETVLNRGTSTLERSWEAQLQSGGFDLAWTLTVYPWVTGWLGFRYENFQTNFLNPNDGFGGAETLRGDRFVGETVFPTANITLNAWMPYLGVVYHGALQRFGLDFRAGMIGAPWVLGQVDYEERVSYRLQVGGVRIPVFPASNQIGQGYLVEFFGDCAVGYFYGMRLAAYGKYQFLGATTNVNVGERHGPRGEFVGDIPDVTYRFDFQRQLWGVGGSLSVFF